MRAGRIAAVLATGLVAGLTTVLAPMPGPGATPAAAVAPAAADEPPHPLRWLALGDSYSSGEGVDENDGHCAQSEGAYARVANDLLDSEDFPIAEQEFLACSGAQVPNVTGSVDLVEQIDQASGRYDLITLSVGGNDAGFGDVVLDCLVLVCVDPGEDADQVEAELAARIDAVRPSLVEIYERLVDELLVPGGHIVVLGYPRLFEAASEWAWYIGNGCETFSRPEADLIRRLADRANGMIADAVATYPGVVHFLDVADSFEGHNLCAGFATTNEWVNGLSVGVGSNRPGRYQHAFHPNREGHAAEGRLLADLIKALDWSELAAGDMLFDWWMRVRWTPEEVAQGGPFDSGDPVRSLYLGWIDGSATIDAAGNISGRAGADVQPNYPCASGGLMTITTKQRLLLRGRILPSSSSPLGPDLDLTLRFGPPSVTASDQGCVWSDVADFTQPLEQFMYGLEPVHVRVRAREVRDRYGARYDPVPVTLNGKEFVLTIE